MCLSHAAATSAKHAIHAGCELTRLVQCSFYLFIYFMKLLKTSKWAVTNPFTFFFYAGEIDNLLNAGEKCDF